MSSEFFRGRVRGVDLDSVDRTELGEDDHEDVKLALLDVAHRWSHIAGAFRLKRAKIKSINTADVQECLAEVVSLWLDRDYNVDRFGPPNWRWVVKAVAEEVGGSNPALAEKIAKQHPISSAVYRSGPSYSQHRSPRVTRTPQTRVFADTRETAFPPVPTRHQPPATMPARISAGVERLSLNWFPDDGKRGTRIATDGVNMEFVGYDPYPQTETNNWETTTLSCGEVPIDRRSGIRNRPYPMDSSVHGIAVVINNELFEGHPGREGTRIDEKNLIQTFRYLGYRVEVYRQCSSTDITRIFQGIALRDHSRNDSFVCSILSHGVEGKIYGCDSKAVELDDLTKRLCARRCASLAGKPKLFFIQACRGQRRDEGARIACDGETVVPNEADFLFSFATPLGQASFRDLDHGSWYISELCQVLCRSATHLHLNDMLTEVHAKVGGYQFDGNRQAPELTHRLQKNVYFF